MAVWTWQKSPTKDKRSIPSLACKFNAFLLNNTLWLKEGGLLAARLDKFHKTLLPISLGFTVLLDEIKDRGIACENRLPLHQGYAAGIVYHAMGS